MRNKVAVIGGGPAGIATAIQLKRYKFDPFLFEKEMIGGLLRNAYRVENYPGFPQGLSGLELIELFKKHMRLYNINVIFEEVKLLEYNEKDSRFFIDTTKHSYCSSTVVVATGTKPKELGITKLLPEALKGKLYYEIYPILHIKNRCVVIIGAGDTAFDYALNLSQNNEVLIINRREEAKALPLLVDRALSNPDIKYYKNSVVDKISASRKKNFLVTFKENKVRNSVEADFIIIAIGRTPQKDFYSHSLTKREKELLSKGLLYLTGDIKDTAYRQVAIAVGDGINTAMKIYQKMR